MRIAAIDQGTTSTRTLVFGDGTVDVAGSMRHRTAYPQPGWVEQNAEELLANIGETLAKAGNVDAIGLANQGESCLAWDATTGEPLSPVIVWQDTRTAGLLDEMRGDAAELVATRAALPLDPYFSAAKLGWIVRNLPRAGDAHAAGRLRLGTTDAFFLDRLTGIFATDCATASRTSLMNIETGEWDAELCRMFGVPIECLPPIRPNTAGFGAVGGIGVAAAIVDQQAALYGHGCRDPGDVKITFGTGAFALAVTGDAVPRASLSSGLVPTVAWNTGQGMRYAVDGGVQDAGSAVEWAVRAGIADKLDDFSRMPETAAIERGLVFVPAFSGLGCPYWDRSASPLLIGLRPDMSRADIRQALLEGIALLTAAVLGAIRAQVTFADEINIDGGLSRNQYFAQFLADCAGLRIAVDSFAERTAYGVASLAAFASGQGLALPVSARTVFSPARRENEWKQRFAEAVSRARGW